jgi:hypothetical protein
MTIEDVYYFFYVSFLRIPPDRIEIIKKTESSITTGCTNDCPVLNIATIIGEDTRNACVRISKGPCNYFIRKLGTNIHYENDYRQIRPHYPKCIETVYFTTDTSIQ